MLTSCKQTGLLKKIKKLLNLQAQVSQFLGKWHCFKGIVLCAFPVNKIVTPIVESKAFPEQDFPRFQ